MKPLPRVRGAEHLDEARHDMAELEQSLGHVASVNRWLGGTSAVLRYVKPLIRSSPFLRILDVATGSADIPVAIAHYARKQNRRVHIVASDIHPQMLAVARKQAANFPEISICGADALKLPFASRTFDVALLSLALHHFDDDLHVPVLREMARVTRKYVLANDLERTRLNYGGAKLLAATLWRGNRLTRHDGPLSVLRSFTRDELEEIGRAAGLGGQVQRHYFQRIVLIGHTSA